VYTSKQAKLDCLPEGRVLDNRHVSAWNNHVHQAMTKEAILENVKLWSDVIGRRDKASAIAHKVATIQRANVDLKKLGSLTNSLAISDVNEEGAYVDAVGANDDPVQLQVTVQPDKIREFIAHCQLSEAQVAHQWAETAMALVGAFDYKTSSLPKYVISVEAVVVEKIGKGGGEQKNKLKSTNVRGKAKSAGPTDDQVIKHLRDKGDLQPAAARMSLHRLFKKIENHEGSFKNFEPTTDEEMWLRMTDLVLVDKTGDVPAWIVTSTSRRVFKKVAWRRTGMRACSWTWTRNQEQVAVQNWYAHIGMEQSEEEESDSEQGEDAAEAAVVEAAGSSKRRRRRFRVPGLSSMHACVRACACAQVQDGSIIIMHMPERGFRDHTLAAMAQLLAGLTERGLHVVTLCLSSMQWPLAGPMNATLEQAPLASGESGGSF
jgi:hypothetical protein